MKKIYLVSELFYPNKTSTSYIMTEIAKHISITENVSVICSKILYDKNIAKDGLSCKINLIRTSTLNLDKNKFIFRIINAVYNSFSMSFAVIKNIKKEDKVLAVTNPFLLILIVGLLRSIKNFKYVLLVHDVFPENTIPAGINNKSSFFYSFLLNIYNKAYRKADQLIVLGNDMKVLLENKGVDKSKIEVIPNWFDSDLNSNFDVDIDKYLNYKISNNKIVIGFAGNIGRVQNLEQFVRAFNKSSNLNILLVIIGEGASKNKIVDLITDERVLLLDSKPRSEQNQFLNCFDLGLVTLADGMFGLGVPSKIYNLLALGKTILYVGDRDSEIDQNVRHLKIGFSFNWKNEAEILVFLNNLKKENLIHYKNHNIQVANEYYSQVKILNRIKKIMINEK